MKISWGMSIVLAIVSFMAFILYFVITMSTDKAYSHDLVTEEYYKQELTFQHQLDKQKNAQNLVNDIHTEKTREGMLVTFPADMDFSKIEGKMFLYRPSNKQLDYEIPISLSSHQLLVPDKNLLGGRWNIEITWNYENEEYFYKKEFRY